MWREVAGRGAPFLLIVGASGAGKSSLARAGLIERITTPGAVAEIDLWRVAVMRPSDSTDGPYRGKLAYPNSTWEQAIKGDFAALRKAGIRNPLMDEVEADFAWPVAAAPSK